ncbi:hypothetical protein NDU88_005116 [Pleurodeles waltl]|uniref:Uncharacterized protein n=1 Tax=Pleurodeles waltl TaxID=8319 RepID=A0AAV7PMR2_PLEWA|nr:hypothetical protein NDU88_005116 [Pleurodeles waltl]
MTRQRKRRAHKPTDKESRKERVDLLRSLRNQECISDTEHDPKVLGTQVEKNDRLISEHIDIHRYKIMVACIYGPNERQEGFLRKAIRQVLTTKDTDTGIGERVRRKQNISSECHVKR